MFNNIIYLLCFIYHFKDHLFLWRYCHLQKSHLSSLYVCLFVAVFCALNCFVCWGFLLLLFWFVFVFLPDEATIYCIAMSYPVYFLALSSLVYFIQAFESKRLKKLFRISYREHKTNDFVRSTFSTVVGHQEEPLVIVRQRPCDPERHLVEDCPSG